MVRSSILTELRKELAEFRKELDALDPIADERVVLDSYSEACRWFQFSNSLQWTMGSIFVVANFALLGFVMTSPPLPGELVVSASILGILLLIMWAIMFVRWGYGMTFALRYARLLEEVPLRGRMKHHFIAGRYLRRILSDYHLPDLALLLKIFLSISTTVWIVVATVRFRSEFLQQLGIDLFAAPWMLLFCILVLVAVFICYHKLIFAPLKHLGEELDNWL